MRDARNIEGGIRDGNVEGGIGMRSFQLLGCGIVLKLIAGCRPFKQRVILRKFIKAG